MNLFVVGDEVQPWVRQVMGIDPDGDAPARLPGCGARHPRQMADQLPARRETVGVSYYAVDRTFVDALAPVVELLTGT